MYLFEKREEEAKFVTNTKKFLSIFGTPQVQKEFAELAEEEPDDSIYDRYPEEFAEMEKPVWMNEFV